MYKAWCLFFLVCCYHVTKGNPDSAVKISTDSRRLYHELNLKDVVGFPAFEEALKGFRQFEQERAILTLIDFTKPSTEQRLCVIDLQEQQTLFKSHVSHGRNSGGNYAVSFSNQPQSFKSSLGFFRTGDTYYGKNGYSLILEGLEKGKNDKAKERAIVMHGAKYADPAIIKKQGRLGRSLGCPALPPAVSREIINTIKDGALLYIHGNP
ncbi:MAG: murein L,D-transpeptidase catalytic domain family protein [Odoribacter sp.]|nr:murein L,D-transpeptidase catalytic domain family protein [Odoribacter sp.]